LDKSDDDRDVCELVLLLLLALSLPLLVEAVSILAAVVGDNGESACPEVCGFLKLVIILNISIGLVMTLLQKSFVKKEKGNRSSPKFKSFIQTSKLP
jgi:hypothetical protein